MAFDLDAVVAEEKPAPKRNQFSFTFDGSEYKLPNDVDMLALRAASTGDVTSAFLRLLNPEDAATINASAKVLTRTAITSLLNAYYEHIAGLPMGESAASSRSSKSTARPSKPTSKSTTKSRSRR